MLRTLIHDTLKWGMYHVHTRHVHEIQKKQQKLINIKGGTVILAYANHTVTIYICNKFTFNADGLLS